MKSSSFTGKCIIKLVMQTFFKPKNYLKIYLMLKLAKIIELHKFLGLNNMQFNPILQSLASTRLVQCPSYFIFYYFLRIFKIVLIQNFTVQKEY